MARRLENDEDEAFVTSLFEQKMAHDDTDTMVMLAKCCALAHGMEHNAERAETLVSEAAEKGNDEARFLLRIIKHWRRTKYISYWSL